MNFTALLHPRSSTNRRVVLAIPANLIENDTQQSVTQMLTQIYEVSSPEEARSISELGVDHIGVLVGDGRFPRELPLATAAKVAASIVPPSKFSALFLANDILLIELWARELTPDILHLGASPDQLSQSRVAILKDRFPDIPLMRSVPVTGEEVLGIAQSYEGIADFLLLDSYRAAEALP